MTRLIRMFAAAVLLAALQFANPVFAGIIGFAPIRIDLTVNVSPVPTVAPTVVGDFIYNISCTSTGTPFVYPPPALTLSFTSGTGTTPIAASGTATSLTQSQAPSNCAVSQDSRPTAPAGFVWVGAPAPVAVNNVFQFPDGPPSFAAFNDTLTPVFTITTASSPPAGGTVSCNPNSVISGQTSNCSATANTGYTFTGISGCGGTASATTPYTTGAVTAPCTVTGTFSLNSYTVTGVASPLAGGSVTCTPSTVSHGLSTSCTATPATGYNLTGVSGCGGMASTTSPYTTGAVTANCTVTGTFTLKTYAVTAVASPPAGGSLTCTPSTVNHGSTTSCSATPSAGYAFTGMSGCGGAASATSPYATGAVTANCTVTGTFSLNTYIVTGVASPVAGGTVSCTTPVNFNAASTCTTTPNAGYTFTGMSGCGGMASATSPYTTGAVTANCTVTGTFSLNTFVVTGVASPSAGGTVTCTSPVNFNATSTCSATSNTGYRLTGISGCGGTASVTSPYTTGAVSANCTVTGTFVLNTFAITMVASPTAGGTLTCTPNPVTFGLTSTCTATPNAGYTIAPFIAAAAASTSGKAISPAASGGISGCGGVGSSSSPYTTGAITAACTVTANFVLSTFPITVVASPAAGGTVSCAPNPANFGTTSTCTAAANTGYTFTGMSGCGGVAATTSPFTTGAISAACTVTATFTPITIPVSAIAIAAGGGSITCSPNPVPFGGTSTCTGAANLGFRLTSISGCGGTATTSSPFVTGPLTTACTVTALFVPVVVVPATVPVPTLGGWALLLLILLKLGAGCAYVVRVRAR